MYDNGKYSGYTGHRYYAIAEGSGADFVSEYLMNDSVTTLYGWGGRAPAMPANVMLFNPTKAPTKATVEMDYPAIVVNGSKQLNSKFAALNQTAKHLVTVESETKDGFDYDILAEQFDTLISVRRSNIGGTGTNVVIFDLPVYEKLDIEVVEEHVTLDEADRMYLTYLPESVKDAANGTVTLLMLYHGGGEKAEYVALLSTWPELAAQEGFIVVSVDQHYGISMDSMRSCSRTFSRSIRRSIRPASTPQVSLWVLWKRGTWARS